MIQNLGFRSSTIIWTIFVLIGCTQPPAISRKRVVGSYRYRSEDPDERPSDHDWDQLTLSADGRYDHVHGGPTRAKSEKRGYWSFRPGKPERGIWYFIEGEPAQVLLDDQEYPIRVTHGEVRLLIDNDTGIWYVKVE
jgi:hypothetical protein